MTISYRPTSESTRLEIFGSGGKSAEFPLPDVRGGGIETVSYTVLLRGTEEIAGFRLGAGGGGPGELLSVSLGEDPEEAVLTADRLSSTVSWGITAGGDSVEVSGVSAPEILEIEYVYEPESTEEIEQGVQIDFGPEAGPMESITAYLKRGEHRIYLFPWLWEQDREKAPEKAGASPGIAGPVRYMPVRYGPVRYRIEKPPSGFVSLKARPRTVPGKFSIPIPAEMTAILHYPRQAWRDSTYELFSWNLFPEILIFDTADYGVQASFFKRLAFYVEKKGYTGQLLSDGDLADKHGWNAHDYRSIDLASFFQAAEDRRFELRDSEKLLREILLSNGIISYDKENSVYLPVRGGLISISRSSSEYLRKLFLVHEGMHGIFFSSPAYRDGCFQVWEALSAEMKQYWDRFFRWMSYDADNLYLVVNELQAYLLQQGTGAAEYYFRNHRSLPGLRSDAEAGASIQGLLDGGGTPFRDAAEQVRARLYESTGVWQERFFCLELFGE